MPLYKKNSLSLLLCCMLPIMTLSFLSGQVTKTSCHGWYKTIHKSILTPPNLTFPIVWTVLYLMIAIALWRLLSAGTNKTRLKKALFYFGLQMLLNFLWTPVFFGLHSPWLGLIVIILLWISIGMTLITMYPQVKEGAFLLIPYFLWVSFALYLNAVIVYLN